MTIDEWLDFLNDLLPILHMAALAGGLVWWLL